MNAHDLAIAIKDEATRLGFDHCRIVPIGAAPHADFFDGWLGRGHAGEMAYLEEHREKRRFPARLASPDMGEFRSLIVLAVNYHQFDLPPALRDDPSRGLIAAYAWGDDYHAIIRPRLVELDALIRNATGRRTPGKCLVDTGPVLERDWAHAAGIGFTGKNCCTIHAPAGSWLLLATMLVPEVLAYDPWMEFTGGAEVTTEAVLQGLPAVHHPGFWTRREDAIARQVGGQDDGVDNEADLAGRPRPAGSLKLRATCGQCTRCLDGCPAGAFVGPYHLDPQRCISYWTIESQQPIPRELRPLFDNRIFGCDICQEVCPYNRQLAVRTPLLAGLHAQPDRIAPPLLDGFDPAQPYWLESAAFSARFRRSPIKRARRHGMLRNVCVALGNWADPIAIAPLTLALHDSHPLARGHAAWALGRVLARHGEERAGQSLWTALSAEADARVAEEIRLALQG